MSNTVDTVEHSVRQMLVGLGENIHRDGISATPTRVAALYRRLLSSTGVEHYMDSVVLCEPDCVSPISVTGLKFSSLCEHHLLPFYGYCDVVYTPSEGRILGFGEFAKIITFQARRLQLQERMTQQIADNIHLLLQPLQLHVSTRAHHLCISMQQEQDPEIICTAGICYGNYPSTT